MVTFAPDRFDDLRRAWIKDHEVTTMQKRRAQILNRQIAKRKRHTAGAGADPADDTVVAPLGVRKPSTAEAAIIATAATLAPLGWPLGVLLHRRTTALIPGELPAYPITALLWSAVGTGLAAVAMYRPDGSLVNELLAPWLIAQIPATFATAAIYAILEGWLGVSSTAGWWPCQPPPTTSSLASRLGVGAQAPPPRGSARPLRWGLALCAVGTLWMITGVIAATISL